MAVSEDAPVLISGGGLVGLSTAMFLARQGVPSLVIERLKQPSTVPRAAFFHMRTLELFRSAGIEGEVREQSAKEFLPDGAIIGVESLAGRELAAFIPGLNEGVEEFSPCRRLFVSQPGLEPILRARAQQIGAEVLSGFEVTAVEQDSDGVTVTARDVETEEDRQLRGRYLVACEGAHSPTREALGVKMEGRGVFSNSITIYFRAPLGPLIGERNLSIIYINNPVLGGFFRLEKGSGRGFLVVSTVGDPLVDPEKAANAAVDISEPRLIELVRAAAGKPDLPVELEGVARWRATSDVASRYQDGRVFLAGDGAHLMPPNGGFGGNTGIHDAHNLTWKLALVLKGHAAPSLLESYEAERRPIGKMTVEQAYTRYVHRTAPYLGAKDFQPMLDDFHIELGHIFKSNAVLNEPGAPDVHEHPRDSRGRPGSRAPHIWIRRKGERQSILDIFGDGFTVLTGAEGDVWLDAARAAQAAVNGVAVNAHIVGDGGLEDADGLFADRYGLEPSGAALVRPDGFVAWRAVSAPADPATALTNALRSVLGLA